MATQVTVKQFGFAFAKRDPTGDAYAEASSFPACFLDGSLILMGTIENLDQVPTELSVVVTDADDQELLPRPQVLAPVINGELRLLAQVLVEFPRPGRYVARLYPKPGVAQIAEGWVDIRESKAN